MTERPILFSGAMVRAILDGRKTQTRRVVKQQPRNDGSGGCVREADSWIWRSPKLDAGYCHTGRAAMERLMEPLCPYGQLGDVLWVRETHAPAGDCWGRWEKSVEYRRNMFGLGELHYRADGGDPYVEKWRPAIHMPRWACRLTLRIKSVRVERLQDISENDCYEEGIERPSQPGLGSAVCARDNARNDYRKLWDSINAKRAPWASNPWVWCVEFERVK